jgi:FMN phosphatase YigB (HAD superfamily)
LIEEYPGVFTLVQELKERGHRTACLSNTNAEHWDLLTQPQLFPAIGLLDAQLASHLLGCSKPSQEILVKFEEVTPSDRGRIYFFDDNADNVAVAIERGWRAHQVDPFSDPAAQMRSALKDWGLL